FIYRVNLNIGSSINATSGLTRRDTGCIADLLSISFLVSSHSLQVRILIADQSLLCLLLICYSRICCLIHYARLSRSAILNGPVLFTPAVSGTSDFDTSSNQ